MTVITVTALSNPPAMRHDQLEAILELLLAYNPNLLCFRPRVQFQSITNILHCVDITSGNFSPGVG